MDETIIPMRSMREVSMTIDEGERQHAMVGKGGRGLVESLYCVHLS